MPRLLLRDRVVVNDDWQHWEDAAATPGAASPSVATPRVATATSAVGLIIPFEQWVAARDTWLQHSGPLGVVLAPTHRVEQLAPDLAHFALIGAHFTGPSEGRGYTQARQLREQWQFSGELRATGHVRQDQVFFMARCGFNSFELPEQELTAALAALNTFSAAYQPANDKGLRCDWF